MARTIQDIVVTGKEQVEVRHEIIVNWMQSQGAWVVEDRDAYIKFQQGAGIADAARLFEITLRQQDKDTVVVHTEGYVKVLGGEKDFNPKALNAGIPRRKGWKAIQDLWNRLSYMSAGGPQAPVPQQQAPVYQQQAPAPAPVRQAPPPPPQPQQYPCQKCGQPLSFIQQYNRWYCYNCQTYV